MLFPVGSLGVSCSKVRGAGIATVGRCLVALPLGSWVCRCTAASVSVGGGVDEAWAGRRLLGESAARVSTK